MSSLQSVKCYRIASSTKIYCIIHKNLCLKGKDEEIPVFGSCMKKKYIYDSDYQF